MLEEIRTLVRQIEALKGGVGALSPNNPLAQQMRNYYLEVAPPEQLKKLQPKLGCSGCRVRVFKYLKQYANSQA